jgi:hypothetical protein
MRRILSACQLAVLAAGLSALGSSGCATEQKVIKTPYYTLAHPDFWKVKSVAQKEGEPTVLSIGRYSTTVVNDGAGATPDAVYENSQADVDVHIYAWPGKAEGEQPTEQVKRLLWEDPTLKIGSYARVPQDRGECGKDFASKFNVFKTPQDTLDLASMPGNRVIVIGGKQDQLLVGVVTKVPYEQDVGLYCHNLANMRIQLQNVLDGLVVTAGAAPAPAPATTTPPAGGEPAAPGGEAKPPAEPPAAAGPAATPPPPS